MKRKETDTQEDIQALARAHSADAIAVLAEIMNNTDAPAGARLSAAKALLDRGWGKAGAKPPDDGNRATPVSQIKRVIVDPRRDDATRPSLSANAPMTNRTAAGLSSNLERGRLGFSYERSELEKLTPLRAERRGVPASRRAFTCAASIRCRYGLFVAFAGPAHLLMRLRRAAPTPAPRAPPAATGGGAAQGKAGLCCRRGGGPVHHNHRRFCLCNTLWHGPLGATALSWRAALEG